MAKCKICKTEIYGKDIMRGYGIKIVYHDVNVYFCGDEHCKQWIKEEREKELEKLGLDNVYQYVKKEIFRYSDKQRLSNAFFTRLTDLRNGTTRGTNYNIKNNKKEGYPWEVILSCFKSQTSSILYWLDGKLSSAKESERMNYMMAIIESNINDEYNKYLSGQQTIDRDLDVGFLDAETPTRNTNVNNNDLSAFFDND